MGANRRRTKINSSIIKFNYNKGGNVKNTILLIAGLLTVSAISFADTNIMGPPTLVPTPNNTDFNRLQNIYEKGVETSEEYLKGDWKLVVGKTSAGGCVDINYDYSSDGIKNTDKSIMMLSFKRIEKSDNKFGDDESDSFFTVMINNLGKESKDQGPYVVDTKVPQFSQWAYLDGVINNNVYFEYSCKRAKFTEMVCKIKLKAINEQELEKINKKCTDPDVATYVGLMRM